MTKILSLMHTLQLSETTIVNTITKINNICGTLNFPTSSHHYYSITDGNGDGNN